MSGSGKKPWEQSMPDEQFAFMQRMLAAPSPIGLEGAMTHGVIEPYCKENLPSSWKVHRFQGNAGIVIDSMPDAGDDVLSVMVIGHADKIRMQVRHVGEDGKIWINTDSFLPSVLIGHEVTLFSENPEDPGQYRQIDGGTIEAIGAIHFAENDVRTGAKGLKKEQIYLELQLHGENRQDQVKALGIKPGDAILLKREIRRGFAPDTFYGAYLDNGLGCFVATEAARLLGEGSPLSKVRYLGAIATHEEIGRFGSRVLAQQFQPDILIGVDVSHDYDAAPGVSEKRFSPIRMGGGFSMSVGAICSAHLNTLYQRVAREYGVPYQVDVVGRDTGTDAMAGVFACIDAAAASIGFPIRNMHTISECGHTGDVLAAIHGTVELVRHLESAGVSSEDFRNEHPRLDQGAALSHKEV